MCVLNLGEFGNFANADKREGRNVNDTGTFGEKRCLVVKCRRSEFSCKSERELTKVVD